MESSLSSFSILEDTIELYQLSKSKGKEIIFNTRDIVLGNWEKIARRIGIPREQIKRLKSCFEKQVRFS